jgi:hypothetical protein
MSKQPSRPKSAKNIQPAGGRAITDRQLAQRQATRQRAAREAARRHDRKFGLASIAIVLLILATLVSVRIAGEGGSSGSAAVSPAEGTPVPAALMHKLASIPLSTLTHAPTGGVTAAPTAMGDPTLTVGGKPDLLYIGAEFCPICATERWAMYVALSKFGTFSPEPGRIHSAQRDGDIETLTFYKTTFTSPYLTFTPVETTTNKPDGDYYVALQRPTSAQLKLWSDHTDGSVPWLDFGGKLELETCQYDPSVLEGQSFDSIVRQIGNNSTTIGADVDASAKVLINSICGMLTGNKPAGPCSTGGYK